MLNQVRRQLNRNYWKHLTMLQFNQISQNNNKKGHHNNQQLNKPDIGTNLLRAQQNNQIGLKEQKNQENELKLMSEQNDLDFSKEYSQQHYSKRKAIKDVVESLYFQDHTKDIQYEYLKKFSNQNNNNNNNNLEDIEDGQNKLDDDMNVNETELKNNFDSLQNFLEEDLELTNGQYKNLVDLSSSAKTAVQSSNDGTISIKKIPECSQDILPIIEKIHLNCHLLAFFVKYQKFFFSLQYYNLLIKLKQNIDDLDYIKEFEMNKYEQKRKMLQSINPQAKLKFKPVFLNAEETKAHYGYQILIRNLKQKFQHYDAKKSIQIMRVLINFDKDTDKEFFDIVEKLFNEQKREFSTYELVAYLLLLAQQSESKNIMVNRELQQKVVSELMNRDESEFTNQILNLIIKIRVMFPLFSVNSLNAVLNKMQNQFTRLIPNFTTKQLLEIALVFLTNNIHFQKHFVEILFISILKNLPQEKYVKSKVVIKILDYFQKQNLYYLQRIDQNDNSSQQQQISQSEQEEKDIWSENISEGEDSESQDILIKIDTNNQSNSFETDLLNRQKEDSLTKVYKHSIKTVLKIDGLFDALLSSVVREISSGVLLKPYSLHALINVLIQNKVQKQAYYDLFVSEYAKILPKASFLMFARMYQILSDQRLIQKPLHILSASKIKQNLKTEYVSYQKTQQLLIESYNTQKTLQNQPNSAINSSEQHQNIQRQIKLTNLLLVKLNFCISNIWSYVLNCVRFEMVEQIDQDILSSAIIYSNSLIADIDKYVDQNLNTLMELIQKAQQINNFIELETKKIVPPINISKLVSNIHMNIVDSNNHLKYSSKLDLLFQLHKRQFNIKYSPYIEKNALVNGIIYDLKIKNIETSSQTLLNIVDLKNYNYQGQERGIQYLKRHFSKLKQQSFIMIDFKEFEDTIIEYIESGENNGKNIPNFIEFKLSNVSLPQNLKFPQEIQTTLDQFDEQIAQIYNEYKIEYEKQLIEDNKLNQQKINKFSKYSQKKDNKKDKLSTSNNLIDEQEQLSTQDNNNDTINNKNISSKENKYYQID